jgi:hypothetical protein
MSVNVRKADIKKNYIGLEARTLLESGASGLSDHNAMPDHLKKHRHCLRRGGVVVND